MSLTCFWREEFLKTKCEAREQNYISLEENWRFRALNVDVAVNYKNFGNPTGTVTMVDKYFNAKEGTNSK